MTSHRRNRNEKETGKVIVGITSIDLFSFPIGLIIKNVKQKIEFSTPFVMYLPKGLFIKDACNFMANLSGTLTCVWHTRPPPLPLLSSKVNLFKILSYEFFLNIFAKFNVWKDNVLFCQTPFSSSSSLQLTVSCNKTFV